VSDIQKGHLITLAFQYIQQVFKECQRLIFKIDNQLAPEWGNLYGNRITKDVSTSLQEADRWIVEAIFRVYQNNKDKLVNKCITITFWGDEVEEPIITAGKIVYSDIDKRDHWDLWNIWFYWSDASEDNNYELDGRRRLTPMGEMPLLSGMIFCADCGNKMYQVRGRGWEHEKEYFVCATYRKVKGGCSSHQIRNVVVEELLLDGIRRVTAFARNFEEEFVEMVTKKTRSELDKSMRDSKRELEQAQARIAKLDEIIQRLYEDNIEGKISDERFAKMTANYEAEQQVLEKRVMELKSIMTEEKESALNVDHFLSLVRKYTDIKELTAEIIREFVEKIYVYKAERIDGRRVQRIKIVWNCIGEFEPPVSTTTKKNEKSA
jgi:hypothetical protein